jgi:simple sugar transport system permease protein
MKIKIFKSYEFFLVLLLITVSLTIGIINPAFFSIGTLFDVFRIQMIYILLAFALLLVLIMGGVDISFVAIAAVAVYPTHVLLMKLGYDGGIWLYYILCTIIGILVGLLIGFLLGEYKLSIFDLSLGMNTMLYGFIVFFIGSLTRADMPKGLVGWNSKFIIVVDSIVGTSGLHISFLSIIGIGILLN